MARFGADKTILCGRRGDRVEQLWELRQASTMQVVGRIVEIVRRHRVQAVFVDAAGVGGGVVDRLKELGQPVVEVQVGSSAHNTARFTNLRAELFWGLRKRFLAGEIALPDDAEMIGQLLALRYDFTSSGQVQIEGKPEMRRRGLASPDKADALALAFMGVPSMELWV